MIDSSTKKIVADYKSSARKRLLSYGIEDKFTLKIKKPKNSNWVAIYRCYSQFNNGGRGPIFWISDQLINDPEQFTISILHEYGHVIAEYAWMRSPALKDLISKTWKGQFFFRPWDEEEFAEEFAQFVYSGFSLWASELREVIETYVAECLDCCD